MTTQPLALAISITLSACVIVCLWWLNGGLAWAMHFRFNGCAVANIFRSMRLIDHLWDFDIEEWYDVDLLAPMRWDDAIFWVAVYNNCRSLYTFEWDCWRDVFTKLRKTYPFFISDESVYYMSCGWAMRCIDLTSFRDQAGTIYQTAGTFHIFSLKPIFIDIQSFIPTFIAGHGIVRI